MRQLKKLPAQYRRTKYGTWDFPYTPSGMRKEVFIHVHPCLSMAKKIILNIDDLTYQVNGAIFEVNNQLSPGFMEKVYENALCIELKDRGLPVKSQVPLKVKYKGYIVGDYYADIVVADTLILELKAVSTLTKLHEAQLLNYLRATGIDLGWLVNFAHARAEIKRFKL